MQFWRDLCTSDILSSRQEVSGTSEWPEQRPGHRMNTGLCVTPSRLLPPLPAGTLWHHPSQVASSEENPQTRGSEPALISHSAASAFSVRMCFLVCLQRSPWVPSVPSRWNVCCCLHLGQGVMLCLGQQRGRGTYCRAGGGQTGISAVLLSPHLPHGPPFPQHQPGSAPIPPCSCQRLGTEAPRGH